MSAVLKEEKEAMIGGMSEARLEFHFDNWRRWMKKDDVTTGYPGKAAGCVGGGYSQTFDDMVDAEDIRCARILDALVNSLEPIERAAIYHRYLYAVFRHGRDRMEEALHKGRYRVAIWLVQRGVY
jgi:hypothetical protein